MKMKLLILSLESPSFNGRFSFLLKFKIIVNYDVEGHPLSVASQDRRKK